MEKLFACLALLCFFFFNEIGARDFLGREKLDSDPYGVVLMVCEKDLGQPVFDRKVCDAACKTQYNTTGTYSDFVGDTCKCYYFCRDPGYIRYCYENILTEGGCDESDCNRKCLKTSTRAVQGGCALFGANNTCQCDVPACY